MLKKQRRVKKWQNGGFNTLFSAAGLTQNGTSTIMPQPPAIGTLNGVGMIPGVGTVIGGAMKVGELLSDGLTALGVGTDQMTTADKILDSKFLKLTPVGLINSIGAKKADTIYKDNETWEQQGSAYGGSLDKVDNALTKSGKSMAFSAIKVEKSECSNCRG